MGQIKNNDKIMFNGNNYYATQGGYALKDETSATGYGAVMSKRDMATVIGLPIRGFSNETDVKTLTTEEINKMKGEEKDAEYGSDEFFEQKEREKEILENVAKNKKSAGLYDEDYITKY